jgi:hypothetical protein
VNRISEFRNIKKENILYLFTGLVIGIILINVFQIFYPNELFEDKNNVYDELNIDYENLLGEYQELSDKFSVIKDQLNSTEKNLEEKISENVLLINSRNELSEEIDNIIDENEQLLESLESVNLNYTNYLENSIYWENYIDNKMDTLEIPLTSKVDFWLRTDASELLIDTPNYDIDQLAVLLYLKARGNNWRVGVISISGNFSDVKNSLLINAINTKEGLVYFDVLTDKTYHYEDYLEIKPGEVYKIGKYRNIHVSKVDVIISY